MRVADFHNDILTMGDLPCLPEIYRTDNIVTAVYNDGRSFSEALKLTDRGTICAFEDLGYADFDYDKLVSVRPVYAGLTHNGENAFGYGCNYGYGLKKEGLELVRRLSRDKIAVDTAHISKCGFKDIIDLADCVVNSHTCFCGKFRHKRNIEDWQIKLIVEKRGLIGVTFVGYFMTEKKRIGIDGIIGQIDYFCQKFGYENLCVGTDFYGTDFTPENCRNYGAYELISNELIKLGYGKTVVEKILFGNLTDFLEKRKCRITPFTKTHS